MLTLNTGTLELRSIETKFSQKTGKAYYILRCEDIVDSKPYCFVCKDFNLLPQGLKKGDFVTLSLVYNRFKEFDVLGVEMSVR